jgi:hypothetical protein
VSSFVLQLSGQISDDYKIPVGMHYIIPVIYLW